MDAIFIRRVALCLQAEPVAWRAIGRGYSATKKHVVELSDGRSAFVKQAVDDGTAAALRAEHQIYSNVCAPFVPSLLSWDDDKHPILIIEDLSECAWPPPWNESKVAEVLRILRKLAVTPPPRCLRRLRCKEGLGRGWKEIAEDPNPFLRLGVVAPKWFEKNLPVLLAADAAAKVQGDAFLHFDVRSDNLCFRGNHALLIDWNWACIGNAHVDIALWLPSLHVEGGPHPRDVMPDQPALAARAAGHFADRAVRSRAQGASRWSHFQLAQLRVALSWATEELDLEPPAAI
ncbi:MAG: phosphotransferase [Chloroflexi bacterium]|nr:phosphotransferase [Chloroflexota bacterium]